MSERTPACRCHCRRCGAHFTSEAAFDLHRQGPSGDRRCDLEDERLIEIEGGHCRIADPEYPIVGVTLYEHANAQKARDHFRAAA